MSKLLDFYLAFKDENGKNRTSPVASIKLLNDVTPETNQHLLAILNKFFTNSGCKWNSKKNAWKIYSFALIELAMQTAQEGGFDLIVAYER